MKKAVLSEQAEEAWISYLRGYAAVARALNARLSARHGLTMSDYEVLLLLSRAPKRRMKRVELARQVVLTPSGITRLLDGLEAQGYVARATCPRDARVIYAVLTDAGARKLEEVAETHLADVDELFAARFTETELETLGDLLGRLDPNATSCA